MQESTHVVVTSMMYENSTMTMLIEKYFLINESIMRQTAYLESTLKEKEKQPDDRVKELMKEIESMKQEDNLES